MLTNEQYKFLKDFEKLARKSKETYKEMRENNWEKVSYKDLMSLFDKYPRLYPSDPFNKEKIEECFYDKGQKISINNHLKNAGLDAYIEHFEDNYGLTVMGKQAMEEYVLEKRSKIRLPIISIVIASLAFLVSLISIILTYQGK